MKEEAARFLLALQFLTRIPTPTDDIYSENRMAASLRYYPLVGALIGLISAAVLLAASFILPQTVAVALAIAAGLLVTGAFHEDGLADTFDGIGGGMTREKALLIMKDSRLGTYGTLALMMVLGLKFVTLSAMTVLIGAAALVAAHGLSRLSSVFVIATSRYVRDDGTGKPVAESANGASLAVAFVTGLTIIAIWIALLPAEPLGCGLTGLILGHLAMRGFFERKLGGYTGDTLGAVQQASEIGFYLGVAAWL
ncbi:MAG: adenosylcobinamide-GDP ribazoletransferase [Pseudomonadota bacterium]